MPLTRLLNMKSAFTLSLSFILLFGLVGCAPKTEVTDDGMKVWVTLLPQKSMVEAVLGEQGTVEVMVRAGHSPETYSPGVPQMAALSKADLYFGIGMPLEQVILGKLTRSMPNLKFVQTAEAMHADHGHDHGHAHHAGCAHGDTDPHVWMDPIWMVDFVRQVEQALVELDPSNADTYQRNAAALTERLQGLDPTLRAQLSPYAGRRFYINHPSLGHFAERYELEQVAIEQAGSAPSARQVAELVQLAKTDQVGAIFTQPEFGRSSADVLARALEVEVIEIDVLSDDYWNNMQDIAHSLEVSFQP